MIIEWGHATLCNNIKPLTEEFSEKQIYISIYLYIYLAIYSIQTLQDESPVWEEVRSMQLECLVTLQGPAPPLTAAGHRCHHLTIFYAAVTRDTNGISSHWQQHLLLFWSLLCHTIWGPADCVPRVSVETIKHSAAGSLPVSRRLLITQLEPGVNLQPSLTTLLY